jgi:hypothetical protein
MYRRVILVFLVLVAVLTSAPSAADRTSFGLGLGALYNGLGGNIALVKADDLKVFSLGCSEATSSSIDGTNLTCGVGFSWLRSDILTKKNSKHGLGVNVALDYDQFHSKTEPVVRVPYIFFFKGIDRRGLNIGLAPFVRWEADGTEFGALLEIGYQF